MAIGTPVQIGTRTTSASTNASITTTGAAASGDKIIIGVAFYDGTTPRTITVSISGLGAVNLDISSKPNADTRYTVQLYSVDAPAGLASSSTISITASGVVDAFDTCALTVSGLATSSYIDQSGGNSNASATASVALSATTNADDLIVMVGKTDLASSSAYTPAGSYNELADFFNSGDSFANTLLYRIVAATGSYTPSSTNGSGSPSVAAAAAYKAAASGAATGVTPTFNAIPFMGR